MSNPKIDVGPSFDAGAFYITIDGEQAHVPFTEVTPHVSDLLSLLERIAIEQYYEENHE